MSLNNIINELIVSEVEKSIEFYKNNFGFVVEFSEGNPVTWAQLKKDNLVIMLEDYNEVRKEIINYPEKVNSSNLIKFEYGSVEEINNLCDVLKENGVMFFLKYKETDYGKIEYGIYDLDNNMIIISAHI